MSIIVPAFGPTPNSILLVGEAPGCVSGDTLVDIPRDKSKHPKGVPIKDLVGYVGLVYSFDIENQSLELGQVRRVWKTGRKIVYKVTYEWHFAKKSEKVTCTDHVLVTEDHKFLLKKKTSTYDPFASAAGVISGVDYLSIKDGLSIGHGIQPILRTYDQYGYYHVGSSSTTMRRESRYLLGNKIGRKLTNKEQCHHIDENKSNDFHDNLELLGLKEHARHHTLKHNPLDRPGAKEAHTNALASEEYRSDMSNKLKKFLSDPEEYNKRVAKIREQAPAISATVKELHNTEAYYWNYLQGRLKVWPHLGEEWAHKRFFNRFPGGKIPLGENHRVVSIEEVGEEDVYDMEVEKYHNFACNGIFVHNSQEANYHRPFAGRSGDEQRAYLSRHGITPSRWRMTNLIPEFTSGNPDPTPEQIAQWSHVLLSEIVSCRPTLIIAVGRFAARFFLGESLHMEEAHGLLHLPHSSSLAFSLLSSVYILPIYHPAAGFYDNDIRAVIDWDYTQVAMIVKHLQSRGTLDDYPRRVDELAGRESYQDIPGTVLYYILDGVPQPSHIAIDTEGTPSDPYSLQVSWEPGVAWMVRRERLDFENAISILQRLADTGTIFVMHNAMYDLEMLRVMGLNLSSPSIRIIDTMYMVYLLRLFPQGLKPSAYRWLGMSMTSHEETISKLGSGRQLDYLEKVSTGDWGKPIRSLVYSNSGTEKFYTPKSINSRAEKILSDYHSGKLNKKGEPTDPRARWLAIPISLRSPIEKVLGSIPYGSMRALADVDFPAAVTYSCKDADATLRLFHRLTQIFDSFTLPTLNTRTGKVTPQHHNLWPILDSGCDLIPLFEEMQSGGGFLASRSHFAEMVMILSQQLREIQFHIASNYIGWGEVKRKRGWKLDSDIFAETGYSTLWQPLPYNPNSSVDVAALMERRGLAPAKYTKTGAVSTSMKSIQHHVNSDIVIRFTVEYRKSQKVLNAFCKPILKTAEDSTPLGVPNLDGLFSIPGMVQEKETIDPVVTEAEDDDVTEDENESVLSIQADLFPVRTQIKITRTATRRLADFLLTVPVRTPLGRRIREGFKCPPGQLYGSWDLGQIEWRVVMHLCQDTLGLEFLRGINPITGENYDTHKEVAAKLFDIPITEVTKEQRTSAKTINFGIIYGLSPEGLQDQLRVIDIHRTLDECSDLISKVLGVFAGLSQWMQSVIMECRAQGWVADQAGMIRYLPGIWSKDQSIRSECERVAISQKVQGLAQHMIQQAMRKLRRDIWAMQRAGYQVWWCRQIHDELVMRFQADLWPVLDMIVTDALINHTGIEMSVPIESSGHYADNWGDLK